MVVVADTYHFRRGGDNDRRFAKLDGCSVYLYVVLGEALLLRLA